MSCFLFLRFCLNYAVVSAIQPRKHWLYFIFTYIMHLTTATVKCDVYISQNGGCFQIFSGCRGSTTGSTYARAIFTPSATALLASAIPTTASMDWFFGTTAGFYHSSVRSSSSSSHSHSGDGPSRAVHAGEELVDTRSSFSNNSNNSSSCSNSTVASSQIVADLAEGNIRTMFVLVCPAWLFIYCFCFSMYFSIAPDAYRCVFAVVEFFVVEFGGAAVAAASALTAQKAMRYYFYYY